jgi:hypothetical protein
MYTSHPTIPQAFPLMFCTQSSKTHLERPSRNHQSVSTTNIPSCCIWQDPLIFHLVPGRIHHYGCIEVQRSCGNPCSFLFLFLCPSAFEPTTLSAIKLNQISRKHAKNMAMAGLCSSSCIMSCNSNKTKGFSMQQK